MLMDAFCIVLMMMTTATLQLQQTLCLLRALKALLFQAEQLVILTVRRHAFCYECQ